MYELRSPAADLLPYIEHYWFVRSPIDVAVDVFVDGRADLIFNFAGPYTRIERGEAREVHASNLDAQRLWPIRIEQRGEVVTTGVRFRLGGLGAFVRQELRALTNRTPHPAEVFDEIQQLESRLRSATLDVQAQTLDDFFRARLRLDSPYRLFERGVLEFARGEQRVSVVATNLGISERQLDRNFARFAGFSPKMLVRIYRFQSVLRRLMFDPKCSLADVAADAGYFDQAHLVKDFKLMSGGVPRGYRGYFPPKSPEHFAPNLVVFLQDATPTQAEALRHDKRHQS